MHYIRRPEWALKETAATPEAVFWNRRAFLTGGATFGAAAFAGGAAAAQESGGYFDWLFSSRTAVDSKAFEGTPFTPKPPMNPAFVNAGREITDEIVNSTYNNFYEFASHKKIFDKAQALPTDGWTVKLDGMVAKEQEIGIEDLLKKVSVEERVIRHRCVEAWSMVVPWIGFKLSDLMAIAEPQASAKYVRFESFNKPDVAAGQRASYYPWPYVEGLTIEEAANDLTFMVVGAYGKVLPKQFGAPVRLHVPWKYGFKSNKSITRISFTDERPVSFWEEVQAKEYGFWANVNPEVSHPRWSQATERVLGTEERIPTQLFNGYGPQVASLYAGMENLGDTLYR